MRVGDLDMDIPSEWEDHSLYTYLAPVEDISPALRVGKTEFRANVVIQPQPLDGDTLDDRVRLALENTQKTFGDVEVEVTDGPQNEQLQCRRLVYTVVDGVTNQPVSQLLYICVVGEVEWQIAFSVPAISMRARLPEFDRMVASIRRAGR